MAVKKCSVINCGKQAIARGWCSTHWARWRKSGNPMVTKTATPGEPLRLVAQSVEASALECLIWPFAKSNGYGFVYFEGKNITAHRAALILLKGPPPEGCYYAAHNCGNGHLGCYNPHHCRWATPKENSADMEAHGTKIKGEDCYNSILTESDVLEIYHSTGKTQRQLAFEYGVSEMAVSSIKRGRTWRHLTGQNLLPPKWRRANG